jgi:putative FmdB family regulatory protein
MPIYEYECDKCGHAFEREQSMSEPPVKTCPKCKGRKVTKLISRSSFVLKGGGWYADGYGDAKKKSSGDATPSGTSDAPSPGASTSGASESKSASDTPSSEGGKQAETKPAKAGDKSSSKSKKPSKASGKSAA